MSHYTYNIVGIDPGTNTGISIINVNENYEINSIELRTINFNHYVTSEDNADKVTDKLFYLDKYISRILDTYNPKFVSMEAAFVNNRFPSAGLSLAKYTAIIEVAIRKYSNNVYVSRYAPKYIKKYIGAGGNAIKDDMTDTILSIKELIPFIKNNSYTEHSIDATAIAYVTLEEIRNEKILFSF